MMPARPVSACVLCPCRWRREQWVWQWADPGYRTCAPCADRLADWLGEIRDLTAMLDPAGVAGGGYVHGNGYSSRSPARDVVIALCDPRGSTVISPGDIPSVPAVLHEWALYVRERRRLAPGPLGVAADVATLLAHLPWLTAQDAVGELDAELGELRTALRRGAGMTSGRRPPDGQCPACGRPVWAPDAGDTVISCRCGQRYERRDWHRLRFPLPSTTA